MNRDDIRFEETVKKYRAGYAILKVESEIRLMRESE